MEENWIKSVLKTTPDVEEVLSISSKPAVGNNENYASEVLKLTIKIQLISGEITERSAILKIQPEREEAYKGSDLEYVFDLEAKIFNGVLNDMEKLLKMNGLEEILWPKCFGVKKMALLMEDLVESGFEMIPKEIPLDIEHALLVVKEYGRFHGLSMILINKGIVNPDSIKTLHIVMENNITIKLYQSGMIALLNILEQSNSNDWKDFYEEIRSDIPNIGSKLKALALETRDIFCVFNHGDCWTNNIMFKYNDTRKPISIRLIDFQEGHFNSFAWDLTYLLYASMLPISRHENMDLLLNCYRDSMVNTCSKYDYNGKIPSINQISSTMNKMKYYGFLNAITFRPLLMASMQDDFDIDVEKLHSSNNTCVHHSKFYFKETVEIIEQEIKFYLNYK